MEKFFIKLFLLKVKNSPLRFRFTDKGFYPQTIEDPSLLDYVKRKIGVVSPRPFSFKIKGRRVLLPSGKAEPIIANNDELPFPCKKVKKKVD